jgi:hypothetical protein
MHEKSLISKLIEIGQASRSDVPMVRKLVIEAQDCVLQMHREVLNLLRENQELRRPTDQRTMSSLKQGGLA